MDYAKFLLANEIRKEAEAEIKQRQTLERGGLELKVLPTGDLEPIVYSILDDIKKVADYMDAWDKR